MKSGIYLFINLSIFIILKYNINKNYLGVIPRNDELLRQISQITIQIPPNIYLSQNLQENFKHV